MGNLIVLAISALVVWAGLSIGDKVVVGCGIAFFVAWVIGPVLKVKWTWNPFSKNVIPLLLICLVIIALVTTR